MSDVLISIQPEWCAMILNGTKTIEVRKTAPHLKLPFRCYIYCTKSGRPLVYGDRPCAGGWAEEYCQTYGYSREEADRIWGALNGKVIGEFKCYKISCANAPFGNLGESILKASCLTVEQIEKYSAGKELFFWHISDLKVYDEPRPLTNFHRPCPEGLYCESCAMHNEHPVPHCGNYALEIRRAPQSWCYAEDQT